MARRTLLLIIALTAVAGQGCITLSGSVDREEPDYVEFLVDGKGGTVGVAVFSSETGLTRNTWTRRKVMNAVTGPLLGLVPWPWDLRLVWSPPVIEKDWSSPKEAFDPQLSAAVAARLEKYGFRGVSIDPRRQEGLRADLPSMLKAATDEGCAALYLVWYNEFTRLEYRTEIRRHQERLSHRTTTLTGSALIPSVALFKLPSGARLLARSDTAQRGNKYLDFFWGPVFTFGSQTPLDESGRSIERFIKEVSGRTIDEARVRCADFLMERDFFAATVMTGIPGPASGEKPAQSSPAETPRDNPPPEQPPRETQPGQTPEGGGRG